MLVKTMRNERGFTLGETMIGLGVSLVVLLGVAQSFDMLSKGKKSIELSSDAVEWVQELRQSINTQTQCSSVLSGKTFPATVGAATSIPSVVVGSTTYNVGSPVKTNLNLTSVQLIRNSADGSDTTFNSGGTSVAAKNYVGVLRIQLDKPAGTLGGTTPKPTYIPVRITTDTSGTVLGCSAVSDVTETTCADLNFKWDAATKTCRYRLGQCQYAGSFVSEKFTNGQDSGGFTNPFTGNYSCPTGYDARPAGSYNTASSCGKGCVQNNLAPVYECVICYDAGGNKITPAATAAITYVPEALDVGSDVDSSTNEVDSDIASAITQYQSDWVASAQPCYASGKVFSGSTCDTSGGGYAQNISATMCCSGSVKVCRNGYDASVFGEPGLTYYIPNYMGCN